MESDLAAGYSCEITVLQCGVLGVESTDLAVEYSCEIAVLRVE